MNEILKKKGDEWKFKLIKINKSRKKNWKSGKNSIQK